MLPLNRLLEIASVLQRIRRPLRYGRESNDTPSVNAFCCVAPGVLLSAFAIFLASAAFLRTRETEFGGSLQRRSAASTKPAAALNICAWYWSLLWSIASNQVPTLEAAKAGVRGELEAVKVWAGWTRWPSSSPGSYLRSLGDSDKVRDSMFSCCGASRFPKFSSRPRHHCTGGHNEGSHC
jgi:hypothetical protein